MTSVSRQLWPGGKRGCPSFATSHVGGEHPNTARGSGRPRQNPVDDRLSLGGGRIMVVEMNGLRANSGDLPTLIVQNVDQPGHVSEVTSMLAHKGVNIATMQLYRDHPGGNAVMIIETDKAVPPEGIAWLERSEGITRVTFIDAEREA
ncbi:MAG: ACT domain-containing protein [Christensenellales bacterium]